MTTTLITVLIAILGFVTIAGIGLALTGSETGSAKASKRAQTLAKTRARESGGLKNDGQTPEQRRAQIMKSLKEQERQARKASISIGARMVHAGLPEQPQIYWMICGGVGLVLELS